MPLPERVEVLPLQAQLEVIYSFFGNAMDSLPDACRLCKVGRFIATEVSSEAEAEYMLYGQGDPVPMDVGRMTHEISVRLEPRCMAGVSKVCIGGAIE